MTALVPVLCASCKGRGLAIVGVEPRVVYARSADAVPEQYLFVFVRTEGLEEAKSISLSCPDASLSWLDFSPSRGDDGLFYAVFSPAPSQIFPKSLYDLSLSDFYGGSASISFSLEYEDGRAFSGDWTGEKAEYAYFRKDGRLEFFAGINENSGTLTTRKDIKGRMECRVSGDGGTVCLMPYEEIQ